MEIYVESITQVTIQPEGQETQFMPLRFTVRVWRQEAAPVTNEANYKTEREILEHWTASSLRKSLYPLPHDIAMTLISLDRVNAVEVKDFHGGNGVVIYKDWP